MNFVNTEKDDDIYIRQGIQRQMLFKLAVVTSMGHKTTLDLLRASGEAPYILRNPLELIIYYCQQTPGLYTWKEHETAKRRKKSLPDTGSVEALIAEWKTVSKEFPTEPDDEGVEGTELKDGNVTRQLRGDVDEILKSGLPARDAERRLLKLKEE